VHFDAGLDGGQNPAVTPLSPDYPGFSVGYFDLETNQAILKKFTLSENRLGGSNYAKLEVFALFG
jgi:hypothetical protein